MKNHWLKKYVVILLLFLVSAHIYAEGQNEEYRGITDPFGDPANYEFAEDEKEDKEFFHLGRFLMFGVNLGLGVFTQGLGRTVEPGFLAGGKFLYFLDASIAFEGTVNYSNHKDTVRSSSGQFVELDTNMLPITAGFRYYFNVKNAPKAIAIANPYLAFGGGVYMRTQKIIQTAGFSFNSRDSTMSHFGGYGAFGFEFPIYGKHIYLGVDLRYHFVFFDDEDDTFNGALEQGSRGGDYFTPAASISYNF